MRQFTKEKHFRVRYSMKALIKSLFLLSLFVIAPVAFFYKEITSGNPIVIVPLFWAAYFIKCIMELPLCYRILENELEIKYLLRQNVIPLSDCCAIEIRYKDGQDIEFRKPIPWLFGYTGKMSIPSGQTGQAIAGSLKGPVISLTTSSNEFILLSPRSITAFFTTLQDKLPVKV